MADRRPKLLFDAIAAIDATLSFVSGIAFDQYRLDLMRRSAVERQLEILGEACAKLAREDAVLIDRVPGCRLAIGLRNRIIHGYDTVDDEIVFDTVTHDLAAMRAELSKLLSDLTGSRGSTP
jgi:uncharacterized protein with HEPN domain